MEWIINNWQTLLTGLAGVVAIMSIIANFTSTSTDNKIVVILDKIVAFLSLNFRTNSLSSRNRR